MQAAAHISRIPSFPIAQPICPDCQRRMEGGFMLNGVPSAGATEAGQWVQGPPETNFLGYLKLKNRRKLTVYAWRCPGCAQVRLYAPE